MFSNELSSYYAASKWTAIFYILFSMIGNLMVLKMIIAVGYDSYRTYMCETIAKHIAMRNQALAIAFKLCAVDDCVTLETWLRLCGKLQRPDGLVRLSDAACRCHAVVALLMLLRGD